MAGENLRNVVTEVIRMLNYWGNGIERIYMSLYSNQILKLNSYNLLTIQLQKYK